MDWISVEDRLPECNKIVDISLMYLGKRARWTNYTLQKVNNGRKYFEPVISGMCSVPYEKIESWEGHTLVTHWMSLPDPPKDK